ncbi:RNA polymerase sigma-70 factor, ECF subfamily [Pseudomonas fluorescens Q2-87]|uniref:RNA polymerase sigma-70 factor, ECF subfamily n=2 Tax=Pseudomonas TaxID=286 RepID=J2F6R7_PSEFQ|nr:RNA polymerase sigma-70 factor, ECF subfamily [Pseudomonas fluorescens Q2-87]
MHNRGRGVGAMKDTGRSPLVKLFLSSYEDFKSRLRKRLGSEELANDVLHETYLRVDRMVDTQDIAQPNAYLYRMALNIAADRRQADARLLTGDEVEELLHVSDEALDPARVVGGQRELQVLLKALYELPARRRRIFIAARLEEAPHLEISQRFGISTRMVEKEIKAALGHCALRLERKVIQRFGPGAGKPS